MESVCYGKLYKLRDTLKRGDENKTAMENMDSRTQHFAKTMSHIQHIYPKSTLAYQKRMNQDLVERSKNNPMQMITLMDGRQERSREEIEQKRLRELPNRQQSYKSVI